MYVRPPQFKANQYMFTTKGSSSPSLPHPGYTPQFSQARDAHHQVPSEFAPSVQTTTAPTTATPNPLSTKELEAIRKRENRRLHEQYHKEVKESLAENRDRQHNWIEGEMAKCCEGQCVSNTRPQSLTLASTSTRTKGWNLQTSWDTLHIQP
jgi:hypothetical protein